MTTNTSSSVLIQDFKQIGKNTQAAVEKGLAAGLFLGKKDTSSFSNQLLMEFVRTPLMNHFVYNPVCGGFMSNCWRMLSFCINLK